jgi:uncharacterized membrane-anchored protein
MLIAILIMLIAIFILLWRMIYVITYNQTNIARLEAEQRNTIISILKQIGD